MSAVSLSLIVAFCTGIAASWDSWVAKRIDPWVGVAWRTVYGLIATMVLSVAGVEWWNLSGLAWFWLTMAGVLLAGGWLCYMHALQRENSELSVALSATYTLPAVFVLIILGQQVGWLVASACLLVVAGGFVAKGSISHGTHGLVWSLAASFVWGLWSLASWQASEQASAIDLTAGSAVVAIVVGLVLVAEVLRQGKSLKIPLKVAAVKCSCWLVGGFTSWMTFLALDKGPAAQVLVICAAYPLVSLSIGFIANRQAWNWFKLIAVLLLSSGAAIAALAYASK